MPIGRWTMLTVCAMLLAGHDADAQLMPRVYCPPGQASCFGAAFTYTNYVGGLPGHSFLDGVPLTVMSVYIQNLQGSYQWRNQPAPMAFNSFGFFRENGGYDNLSNSLFVNLLPASVSPPKSGGRYGPVREGTRQVLSENSSAEPLVSLSTTYSTDGSGGVMGCNLGRYASPLRGWGWQTCPEQGLNGWVKFDFALWWAEQSGAPHFVTADDFFLTMGAANTSSDYQCGYGRRIGVEVPIRRCASFDYDGAIVTPEPATVVLLASGIGMIGLGMLRRRTARRAA
ncbi:MAG: PEP-CTERM sorting domain-containing protein [Gemmatimonadota bacterium]